MHLSAAPSAQSICTTHTIRGVPTRAPVGRGPRGGRRGTDARAWNRDKIESSERPASAPPHRRTALSRARRTPPRARLGLAQPRPRLQPARPSPARTGLLPVVDADARRPPARIREAGGGRGRGRSGSERAVRGTSMRSRTTLRCMHRALPAAHVVSIARVPVRWCRRRAELTRVERVRSTGVRRRV
ncbi:hypothetical protein HETIRDRAFT_108396 [Heterobasidion irregulare TC 32-1]|uniref:Uncharacterized protein n=1 Tax=Heterobasidion irregulare (strain TC 32-1) TaxID=747525 RepID=W4JPB0_HETIT|nr:uncharacterized protein HETIRDRAFT_108396 [Heterobasidion irregulare TC 32-1]ETW74920.1 hypothetical protein HETIRDRAFT_108396 [Heterobasidion irregulare TC 32-1]